MDKSVLTKEKLTDFFEVSPRTIDSYLPQNEDELKQNGCAVLRGKALQELKLVISESDVDEMYFVNIKKEPSLGVFDFYSFLKLGILISESEKAKILWQMILDIVIYTINKRRRAGNR